MKFPSPEKVRVSVCKQPPATHLEPFPSSTKRDLVTIVTSSPKEEQLFYGCFRGQARFLGPTAVNLHRRIVHLGYFRSSAEARAVFSTMPSVARSWIRPNESNKDPQVWLNLVVYKEAMHEVASRMRSAKGTLPKWVHVDAAAVHDIDYDGEGENPVEIYNNMQRHALHFLYLLDKCVGD